MIALGVGSMLTRNLVGPRGLQCLLDEFCLENEKSYERMQRARGK